MTTASTVLPNESPALIRANLNQALQAIVSNNSNATAPTITSALMWWMDTANNLLKLRNVANSAWVTIGTPSVANFGFLLASGGTMTGALIAAVGSVGNPGLSFAGDIDNGFYWVSADTFGIVAGGIEYIRVSPSGISFLGTGATLFPTGTTLQRPANLAGAFRFNTDNKSLEFNTGTAWLQVAATANYPFLVTDFLNVPLVGIAGQKSDFSQLTPGNTIHPVFSPPATISFSQITSPSVGTQSQFTSWSPSGEYLAVGSAASGTVLNIFKRNSREFVLISLGTPTSGNSRVGAFSPDGQFLFVESNLNTVPFNIYQRQPGSDTFTKLADPASTPATLALFGKPSWSPNSEFLVFGYGANSKMYIYQRSGTTFTKLSDPTTLPTTGGKSAWAPDGRYFAILSGATIPVYIYEKTNLNTFTKIADPTNLSTLSSANELAFSPDGQYLLILGFAGSTPTCLIYQRSGNSFNFVSSNAFTVGGGRQFMCVSPDGQYVATTEYNSNIFYVAKSLTPQTALFTATLPNSGRIFDIQWSPDGQFLSIAHNISSQGFLSLYQIGQDTTDAILMVPRKLRAGSF